MSYLIKFEYISIDQSAYKKYHNTQTSLHRVIDDWLENMNDNVFTGVCLLDIKKCFDSIDHAILLKKMSYYGIRNGEYKLFKSYLTDRKQVVSCKNEVSYDKNINIGVPQGSVLGPVLFMLFVNDLSQHTYLGAANLYADDCLIYCTGNDVSNVNETLQMCIDDVTNWYDKNKLVLNAEKCNVMLVRSKHKLSQVNENECLDVLINQTLVSQVTNTDYLGINIQNTLSWDAQIHKVCKQLSRKVGMLSRIRKSTPRDILIKIYMSSIQPTIDYAITVWGNTTLANINNIQRIQNYAARIVTNEFDYVNIRGAELVRQLKWMSVKQRYEYFCLLLMFKCVHGQAPDYLCNNVIMECEIANRETRATYSNNVHVPYTTTEYARRTLIYNGAKLWNTLPSHVKNVCNIEYFKSHVKLFNT